MTGVEVRGFIRSLEDARAKLAELHGVSKGEYEFTDVYYAPEGPVNLEKDHARIRFFQVSNRSTMPAVRYDEHTYNGKKKSEFTTVADAEYFLQENMPSAREIVRFSRQGEELQLPEASVFLESVEGVGVMVKVEADEQRYIDELVVALHIRPITESLATVAWRALSPNQ